MVDLSPVLLRLLEPLRLSELLRPPELPRLPELLPRLDAPLLRLPELVRLRCCVAAAPREPADLPAVFFRPRVVDDGCFMMIKLISKESLSY